ncbi:MAG: Mut7-C RNAse domain-containing protein [Candidatus Cloacimonas sp.]|jgi:uncharacterized protein with PIN domain|nr:Mut7-C RNAse domain-containing protein [Candidatus Cloacimonadota bacterium]
MQKHPKFIADVNLGRLAKWLRLLGYDTLFHKNISIYTLTRLANSEKRIFLTRSVKNYNKKIFDEKILLKNDLVFEQLDELRSIIRYDEAFAFTRCSACNSLLVEVDKPRIKSLVPSYVYETNDLFKLCRSCGKIYWKGTHKDEIEGRLLKLSP